MVSKYIKQKFTVLQREMDSHQSWWDFSNIKLSVIDTTSRVDTSKHIDSVNKANNNLDLTGV